VLSAEGLKVVSDHQPAVSETELLTVVSSFARTQRPRIGNG
jgi:hypothetical protein